MKKLILKSPVEEIFLGRFDWVIDTAGNLKLLEFNAETPAGLTESAVLNGMIRNHFQEHFGNTLHLQDPNANLLTLVKQQFMNITAQYNKIKPIKTIGFVACSYEEDWYNTGTVLEALSDLPYEFVRGEITGLGVLRGGLTLCGKPVDSIYCYYPHDWLCSDSYLRERFAHFPKHMVLSLRFPSSNSQRHFLHLFGSSGTQISIQKQRQV